MVFHPAWGYFAEDYGLEQIPIEIEGKAPKPATLKQVIVRAKRLGVKVVFVQPQFAVKNAATVAEAIGGKIVFADPLLPQWADNLRRVAKEFRDAAR